MTLTRREFLAAGAGLGVAGSIVGVAGAAFGLTPADPGLAARNRLVVIFLNGGNDGLNYVVPRGDIAGAPRLSVYQKVRPSIAYTPGALLALDRAGDADQQLGFNPKLTHLHQMYRDGRVAIVQGVDYPNHNYSHFTSADIWHSGDPVEHGSTGWLGRHLDRVGVGSAELRAVAVASQLPLMLRGRRASAASMTSINAMQFRDGSKPTAEARHVAVSALGRTRSGDPLRDYFGATMRQTVGIVDKLAKAKAPPAAPSPIGDSLETARALLEQDLGVECVYVSQGSYDHHTTQVAAQEKLLAELDAGLSKFWEMRADVAARTLVVIASEFGRRIGEANPGVGLAGTDHGAAAPVLLIGPPATARPAGAAQLVGGLHGDHPNMGTVMLPADNLKMTTDLRHVYQSVLSSWLADPDPRYAATDTTPLRGLFNTPSAASTSVSGSRQRERERITAGPGAGTETTSTVLGRRDLAAPRVRVGAPAHAASPIGNHSRGVHPVSGAAALAFNAFVAALVIRSGQFREALDGWRAGRGVS